MVKIAGAVVKTPTDVLLIHKRPKSLDLEDKSEDKSGNGKGGEIDDDS